ncbi:acetyl-CoA C-acyltransferase FadA [Blastopirellula sp. JC732]|uniref:acetyl-CoA C-acyltransferase n=1 Tax=Blastopirellula sediminis TaxID=2894196 RepID=A0A9X1MJM1_9BACT|nr:acetyl-CoA C-acyltransferase FadA [Blastopirellula sediminis]MCC9609694.1 acetyl-CoA C-acyltransferase FadA [Blastopirellula sediminis]MCC9627530.1 acetyl-CoA C-acyltransferase FadA [Blastopirellula sediminis]
MTQAVVIDGVRTAIGRAHPEKGVYRDVRSDDLAVACVEALLKRTGVSPQEIEDVIFGCTQQTLEQGLNVGRLIGLMGGVAHTAGGATMNRLCGSSLQALNQAAHSITAGAEDVHIVGGLEHMQHIPMDHGLDLNPKLFQQTSKAALMMGITAEFLAQTQEISRRDQDEFALASHQKATAAFAAGEFEKEIVPVYGRNEEGQRTLITMDQCVRTDASIEALSMLQPAFMPGAGTVTAGNSSPLNDGASALLMMSEGKAKELGLKPLVRVVSTAVAGVDPSVMGTGPIPATKKALKRAGLKLEDIDLIELNEAFAAQSLSCIRGLKLDVSKVNVRGGAIAIGHPLGCSGARIATTLIHAMVDRKVKYGLATMCIGAGQGIATIFERVD